jgi:hypothetical protein
MKKAVALALTLLCGGGAIAASRYDSDSVVSWRNIVGVITAPGVDNPVAVTSDQNGNVVSKISSGTLPWTTRMGAARVDLKTGDVEFTVRGLVLIGGNTTGTSTPISQVTGTLVCNPGSTDAMQPQAILDTTPVALSLTGNARFSGELQTAVPYPCASPLFLIRIGPAFGKFAGRWLAAGVEPRQGNSYDDDREHGHETGSDSARQP